MKFPLIFCLKGRVLCHDKRKILKILQEIYNLKAEMRTNFAEKKMFDKKKKKNLLKPKRINVTWGGVRVDW